MIRPVAILGNGATPAAIEAKRMEMGLDKPYLVRLLSYLNQVFLHFDLGTSYFQNQSVMSGILYRLPYTFTIALICMLLQILIRYTPWNYCSCSSERNCRPVSVW